MKSGLKLHVVGLEPVTVLALREAGHEVVPYTAWPDESLDSAAIWLVTSDAVPVSKLARLRMQLPNAQLIYWYMTTGIAGWQAVHALCLQQDIRFLRPGISTDALLDTLHVWFRFSTAAAQPIVSVFGTVPGIGCTRIAATIAQALARKGKKVILLGLNLFQAGWEADAPVSLDGWRQRLIGRMLQPSDLERLIRVYGFSYLPGNFDALVALDYTEEEITYLLQIACKSADVVIADCGAISESAAWFCGMQQAGLRIMVTHPQHWRSLRSLIGLMEMMEIPAGHLFLCGNRVRSEDLPLKQVAAETGTQPWFSFAEKGFNSEITLSLSRREQADLDEALLPMIAAIETGLPGRGREV